MTGVSGLSGLTVPLQSTNSVSNNLASNLIKLDSTGSGIQVGSMTTETLTISDGSVENAVINGINIGAGIQGVVELTTEGIFNTIISMWDYNSTSVLGKTARLIRTYHDPAGTRYALIRTTYNWNLNYLNADRYTGSNTDMENDVLFMMNTSVSQNLYFKDVYEVVVIGFTFKEKSPRIIIPGFVKVPSILDSILPENNIYDAYYPVREIWACHVYAETLRNSTVHLLSSEELNSAMEVKHIPTCFYAPFITKITLKHRIDNNLWFFSGIGPKIYEMPHLTKIVGLSQIYKAPVLSGLNLNGRSLAYMSFPSLKSIKNCIFGAMNLSLVEVELPVLEELNETTFLTGCAELSEVNLPYINVIRGCDFFCANCANLARLRMNANVRLYAHDVLPQVQGTSAADSFANMSTFLNILEAVMVTIGLTPQFSAFRRFGSTNSMSFFLQGSNKLLNFRVKADAAGAATGVIDVEKSSPHQGIWLTYSVIGGTPVYIDAKASAFGSVVETYNQYIRRLNKEHSNDRTWTSISEVAAAGTTDFKAVKLYGDNYYAIDNATQVMIYDSDKFTDGTAKANYGDLPVVPIDPRTALGTKKDDQNDNSDATTSDAFWHILMPAGFYSVALLDDITTAIANFTSPATTIKNWFEILFGWKYSAQVLATDVEAVAKVATDLPDKPVL